MSPFPIPSSQIATITVDAAPSAPSSRFDAPSPEAQALAQALRASKDQRADLRGFAPEALDELLLVELSDCRDARFVALPAHCSVAAIHKVLTGLPELEGVFFWSPQGASPIRPLLGQRLATVISDPASLSRCVGAEYVKRVACHLPELAIDALVAQAAQAAQGTRPSCPHRRVHGAATVACDSRPVSPAPRPQHDKGEAVDADDASQAHDAWGRRAMSRPGRMQRLWHSVEHLFHRRPPLPLRQSRPG
ncbi:hypothetical protein PV762_16235 [Mitsuaria sp. CC2]|uniref:hypothetical protein n=1 Tax=Mitsuaria sp. CC2 TaxID=3029186 RepID=UPI003B8D11E1